MFLTILILVGGLVLLIGGGDLLVRGVSALAAAAGVPPLVIGLTVVAFGTSTPELVVNLVSASRGQTDLAFGNIVGSCGVNIGFVLALTAIVRPLAVERSVITRQIPLMLLAVAGIVVLSEDSLLGGGTADALNRSDGIMLLLLFCVFLYSTVMTALSQRQTDPFIAEVRETVAPPRRRPTWAHAGVALAGIAGVAAGGRMTVAAAVAIAESLRVPQNIIGLTIVSFGTTLPELTTCILSARRGQADIAIGNIVGSNIFNLLCIAGAAATIRPVPIPRGGQGDLALMAVLSALLLPLAIRRRKITRGEGVMLVVILLGYVGWRTATAAAYGG